MNSLAERVLARCTPKVLTHLPGTHKGLSLSSADWALLLNLDRCAAAAAGLHILFVYLMSYSRLASCLSALNKHS